MTSPAARLAPVFTRSADQPSTATPAESQQTASAATPQVVAHSGRGVAGFGGNELDARGFGGRGVLFVPGGMRLVGGSAEPQAVAAPVLVRHLQQMLATLHHNHVERPQIDRAWSAKAFDALVERLDRGGILLTQGELSSPVMQDLKANFAIMLARGNLDAFFELYNQVEKRQREFMAFALKSIPAIAANEAAESKELERPATVDALEATWTQALTNEVAGMAKMIDEPTPARVARLCDGYTRALREYERKGTHELSLAATDAVADAILGSVDPHSTHFSAEQVKSFMERESTMAGIGILLHFAYRPDANGAYVSVPTVKKPMEGGPAAAAGLQAGDEIVAIAVKGRMQSMLGRTADEVTEALLGRPGEPITVQVRDPQTGRTRTVEMQRKEIARREHVVETAVTEVQEGGVTKRVGFLRLAQFYHDPKNAEHRSGLAVTRALAELQSRNVDAVVLDLRGNPGGNLVDAVEIAGLFIDSGPVVQTRNSDGVEVLDDPDPRQQYNGPLAVMVDRRSASASELVAGSLQSYGRAVIIGERTHGKGTAQSVIMGGALPTGDAFGFKITTSTFHDPAGRSPQRDGVTPDITLNPEPDTGWGERNYANALRAPKLSPAPGFRQQRNPVALQIDQMSGRYAAAPEAKSAKERYEDQSSVETLQEKIDAGRDGWAARAARAIAEMSRTAAAS